jgi:hypothetical protein
METTQTTSPPSFDSVWAILQENAKGIKELKESQKETDQQLKETDLITRENAKLIG